MSFSGKGVDVSAFCLYCVSLQGTAFSEAAAMITYNTGVYPHQPSCAALVDSAARGCPLCRLILSSVHTRCRETGKLDADGRPILPEGEITIGGVVGATGQRWVWVGESHGVAGVFRVVRIPVGWEDAWDGEDLDINRAAVAMVKKWVQTCCADHPECSPPEKDFMPTRLIDVGPTGAERVRLIHTAGLELQDRRYVALSHCWGLNMPRCAQTFNETLTHHLGGIPLTDLTQTFVDAIEIARYLQVPYVWIDSLCIIQDSREDWEAEAAQMADIYSNAYVTLAASASSDGTQGCCIPRGEPEAYWPYVDIPIIGSRHRERYRAFSWSNLGFQALDHDPLQTRGWTLQERELSPRIAHFSRGTVIWECRALRASLCSPWDDPASVTGYRRVFDADSSGRNLRRVDNDDDDAAAAAVVADLPEKEKLHAASEWFRLVKLYSRRSLTDQGDVLPAISGVARVFALFTPGPYNAGIFGSHGMLGLLWATNHPQADKTVSRTARRPAKYTAPSWSWASVVGAVNWNWDPPSAKMETLATVHGIAASPAGLDPFGQVSGGSLRIEGRLCRMRAERVQEAQGFNANPAVFAVFAQVRGCERKIGWIIFDVLDEACEHVFCLACAKLGFPWPQVYGLGLVPVAGDSSGSTYRRIGRVGAAERAWQEGSLVMEVVVV
ncbi:HET-domain-containing protein [Hypoxylon sp. NC1633]|nr:HET-domain-containing protein [Hypoxylon sp. NC1633]